MKKNNLFSILITLTLLLLLYIVIIISPNCSKHSSPEYVYIYITNETTTTNNSNQPPLAKIIVPADNSCFNTSSFIISGTAWDDVLVKSIALTIDNSSIDVQPSSTWSATSGVLSSGTHTISLVIYNNYDASSEPQLTTILIDDNAPLISINSPGNGGETESQVYVSGLATDASSSINSIQLSLDGGSWIGINPTKYWNTSILVASGIHTIQTIAYDSCGNSGTSLITSFTNTSGYAVGWIGGGTSSWQTTNGAIAGTGLLSFYEPVCFCIWPTSQMNVVADRGNNRIQNCNTGSYQGWIGGSSNGWQTSPGATSGSNYLCFNSPSGVYTYNDYIHVADSNNNRISRWNTNGSASGWIGGGLDGWKTYSGTTSGNDYQSFNSPNKFVEYMNDFYIADTKNHRVSKWTMNGVAVGWIGGGISGGGWNTTNGSAPGDNYSSFNTPSDISIGYDGILYLYIADRGNNRISKWTNDGVATGWIGGGSDGWKTVNGAVSGYGLESFNNPAGIDISTYLYIADTLNNRISKWTVEGTAVGWVGGGVNGWNTGSIFVAGSNDYQSFHAPEDVYIDYYYLSQYMYISDTQNHRISKWKK